MAKRIGMSRNQRNKFGPSEFGQVTERKNIELYKQIAIESIEKKKEEEVKKQEKRKRKQQNKIVIPSKALSADEAQAKYGSIEMLRNKKPEHRKEIIKNMLKDVNTLLGDISEEDIKRLQQASPRNFAVSNSYRRLQDLGMNEESIDKADANTIENYFTNLFNMLTFKTLYKDDREKLLEYREEQENFIKRVYNANPSFMSFEDFKNSYYRGLNIAISRSKGMYDSDQAKEEYDKAFEQNPFMNDEDINDLVLRVGKAIITNAEEVLEINRRAEAAREKKRQWRKLEPAEQAMITLAEQTGKSYEEIEVERAREGEFGESLTTYLHRKYPNIFIQDIKEEKLEVAPNTPIYLRKEVKQRKPGDIFSLSNARVTAYYIIEREDRFKIARELDLFGSAYDMQLLEDFESNKKTEVVDFKIDKPTETNTTFIQDNEDMGDLF